MILRRATFEDAQFLFELVNEPSVRAGSLNTEAVAWEGHVQWLASTLDNPLTEVWIIEEEEPMGVLRFFKKEEGWMVGISLAPISQGKGLGSRAMCEGSESFLKRHPGTSVIAYIKVENVPSQRMVERAGYIRPVTVEGQEPSIYRYELPALHVDGLSP